MEAYLNNSFYGNRSYGVAAAARSYWNKDLKDLTLAEAALLAGIPQSPTKFDLVKNAVEETYTDDEGRRAVRLVVPMDSEIVKRRNFILEQMKTKSVLTAGMYSDADYEAAKQEPVILGSQATAQWRAPQFVWQVRDELGQILCGSSADSCEKIDKGGYTVITTLDYRMQRIVEKWVYAAAIIPNSRNQNKILKARGIPSREWGWIKALSGHNIHNAAAGVVDYRTGETLAYAGSASYTVKGNKKPPAPVRRPVGRLAAAGLVDQAHRIPHRDRGQDDDGGHDVHGRRHELRAAGRQALVPDPGRPCRTRAGPPPERPPVLAQHPRDQGRLHQRPGPPVPAVEGLRPDGIRRAPSPSRPRASGPSWCTRST